jgi:dsDNA-binding SOS-regulon protein
MAVIAKYFVVRNGVEIDEVFEDKKRADAYDKMLDASEKLSAFIRNADLPVKVDDDTIDKISVCLAKNAPEVTGILRGIKPISTKPAEEKKEPAAPEKTDAAPVARKQPAKTNRPRK